MPFGPYVDFEDCIAKNQDKTNPEAYCGAIKAEIEGSQKLAGIYATQEDCINDQIRLGKKESEAKEISDFFLSGKQLSTGNLILLRENMDLSRLPNNQLKLHHSILPLWISRKEKNNDALSQYSKEEILTMHTQIIEEMKKRKFINDSKI